MKLKGIFSENNILNVGIFSFLVLITISFLTTNDLSRIVIIQARYLSLVFTSGILFLLFISSGFGRAQLWAAGLYFFLVFWGVILAFFNNSLQIGSTNLLTNTLVTLAGILLFSKTTVSILPDKHAKWFLYYSFFGLISTLAVDGLNLSFPPSFNFSSFREDVDEIFYNQGISKFFGLGTVAAAYVTVNMKHGLKRYLSGLSLFLFLSLSFLGGGRGDSLGALLIVSGYLILVSPIKTILQFGLIAAGICFFIYDWQWLEDFTIYQRLTAFDSGDLGMRDVLINEAIYLLAREPQCLILGCGLGYFQHYFGYGFGMYPHNFLAEASIVFGVPLTFLIVLMVTYGLRTYYLSLRRVDLLLLFFFYFLILGLKSGALLSSPFFNACCSYFIFQALKRILFAAPRKVINIT